MAHFCDNMKTRHTTEITEEEQTSDTSRSERLSACEEGQSQTVEVQETLLLQWH